MIQDTAEPTLSGIGITRAAWHSKSPYANFTLVKPDTGSDNVQDVFWELEKAGAVLQDHHFVYKGGKHGPHYVNVDALFQKIQLMNQLSAALVEPFFGEGIRTIAGPATGAIPFVTLAALLTSEKAGWEVGAVWADEADGDFGFKRAGFIGSLKGHRVLVVEDVLNTGNTAKKICRLAEGHGADVIGVSVICNRGGVTVDQLGVARFEALSTVDFSSSEPNECELCAQTVPIVEDISYGSLFKQNNPDYAGGFVKLLSK